MEFTFCTISYNQSKLIIYHMESIKYLIKEYGKDIRCHFVLADDCSTDNTVSVVEKWIEKNSSLFSSVTINAQTINQGTVKNFICGINIKKTNNFSILAGDDLYTSANLFSLFDDCEFYISPTLHFSGNTVTSTQYNKFFYYLLALDDNKICSFINQQYKYGTGIEAPGMFFRKNIIDGDLEIILKKYRLIEDTPLVNYIVSLSEIKIKLLKKPYVLYRINEGVTSVNSKVHEEYKKEQELLNKYIHIYRKNIPNIFNPFQYRRYLEIKMSQLNGVINNDYLRILRDVNNNFKTEKKNANNHLRLMIIKGNEFYSNVWGL